MRVIYQNDKTAEEAAAALGVERSTVNDAARRIRKKAAAIPFYILILYVQTLFTKHWLFSSVDKLMLRVHHASRLDKELHGGHVCWGMQEMTADFSI